MHFPLKLRFASFSSGHCSVVVATLRKSVLLFVSCLALIFLHFRLHQ
jgi:hypothetical protein